MIHKYLQKFTCLYAGLCEEEDEEEYGDDPAPLQHPALHTLPSRYCVSKKSCPILNSKLLHKMGRDIMSKKSYLFAVGLRSLDPFYIVSYYIKWGKKICPRNLGLFMRYVHEVFLCFYIVWVKTSWTSSIHSFSFLGLIYAFQQGVQNFHRGSLLWHPLIFGI